MARVLRRALKGRLWSLKRETFRASFAVTNRVTGGKLCAACSSGCARRGVCDAYGDGRFCVGYSVWARPCSGTTQWWHLTRGEGELRHRAINDQRWFLVTPGRIVNSFWGHLQDQLTPCYIVISRIDGREFATRHFFASTGAVVFLELLLFRFKRRGPSLPAGSIFGHVTAKSSPRVSVLARGMRFIWGATSTGESVR